MAFFPLLAQWLDCQVTTGFSIVFRTLTLRFSYWHVNKQSMLSDPQLESMLWNQRKWLSEGIMETEAIPAGVPVQRA